MKSTKEEILQRLLNTWKANPIVPMLIEWAKVSQSEVYLIGGFVRDLILERVSKDIDVVCVGKGAELAESFAEFVGADSLSVFKNFGTAQIKKDEWEIEFVGARKESYRADSRKPIVENGSLTDDQNRRDLTINALAISLNQSNLGELIDPFNGIEDLQKKIIRTPLDPHQTFSDDPLRIMRALRFAAQLSFDIEPDTFAALSEMKERLSIISQERITDELNKIILSNPPSYGFKLLYYSGVLKFVFPELAALAGVETVEKHSHKDNFFHTLQVLDNVTAFDAGLWLRWAALLHDIAKPATKRFHPKAGWTFHGHEELGAKMVPKIFTKLRLPLDEKMKYVQKLVRLHLRPIPLVRDEITDSALRRLLVDAGDDIDDLMKLCRADITSKNLSKVKRYLENFDVVEKKLKEVEERDQLRNFQPVITGEHIMLAFDLKPGKQIGIIKEQLREAILEGHIPNDYETAWSYMLKIGKELGLESRIVSPEK